MGLSHLSGLRREVRVVEEITLQLTPKEVAVLATAVCNYYHHMKATESDEIYGSLILNENVLAARSVWNKVEAATGVSDW